MMTHTTPKPTVDTSLILLIFSNGVTAYFALTNGWSLLQLMWVYWIQSITIGFFNFIRIIQLGEFTTNNLKLNGRYVAPSPATKYLIATFFAFHYGLFHLVYLGFMLVSLLVPIIPSGTNQSIEVSYVLFSGVLFFVNHWYSYISNKKSDNVKPNIGTLMLYPYARIVPMHLVIMFSHFVFMAGPQLQRSLVLFLILKTAADAVMHVIEHRVIRKPTNTSGLTTQVSPPMTS